MPSSFQKRLRSAVRMTEHASMSRMHLLVGQAQRQREVRSVANRNASSTARYRTSAYIRALQPNALESP